MERQRRTAELERMAQMERHLERRWRDLALAEQRGQPSRVLERMYFAYLRTLDAYVDALRALGGHQASSRLAS